MTNTSNDHREWTDRLSDFLDGGLEEGERAAVEAHLAECGGCRRVLEELREVKTRAAALGPVEPSRDLWAGIAATIEAPPGVPASGGARVIALPTADCDGARLEETPAPRRFSLSWRQLVAASIALIAASSVATWALGSTPGADTDGRAAALPTESVVAPASWIAPAPPDLADELASLERVLVEARANLDPNTVRVLERNLGVIEQAIADSRRALAQDPGNDFLAQHLRRVYERKLEYLRDAARVAEWSG